MHPLLEDVAHRPWPAPRRSWVMRQTWHDLLFAHWPLPPEALRPLVPPQLELDLAEGRAWLAVTPFHMSGIRARGLPLFPGLAAFPELNLRTYVRGAGPEGGPRPGVFFFSLDARSRIAVASARAMYHLPYHFAEMEVVNQGEAVRYSSRRIQGDAELRLRYHPISAPQVSRPGSLEHFLTERYCLYAAHAGRFWRAEIHHARWPLQRAEAEIEHNTMARAAGVTLPDIPPLLHFSRRLEVLVWWPRPVKL